MRGGRGAPGWTPAAVTAVINAVVNPLIEVAVNRHRGPQPLESVGVNLAVTAVVMSVLVAVFAGRRPRAALSGLGWGIGAAVVVIATAAALAAVGVGAMPFGVLLAVKAGFCGLLAYRVAQATAPP